MSRRCGRPLVRVGASRGRDRFRFRSAACHLRVAGRDLDVLVIDVDASIVVCHSE
jgi:hypothetical protein